MRNQKYESAGRLKIKMSEITHKLLQQRSWVQRKIMIIRTNFI